LWPARMPSRPAVMQEVIASETDGHRSLGAASVL
jgi:hypothetical protein